MRLHYLHLANYPPLRDLTVRFASSTASQEILNRACAIRFVVGLNGSGKSHLLRAVADALLAVADERLPGFPVTLIYELGRREARRARTIVLDCPGRKSEASLWFAENVEWIDDASAQVFEAIVEKLRAGSSDPPHNFRALVAPGQWPQRVDAALPRAVLAYTTGVLAPWQALWQPPQDGEGLDLVTQIEDYDPGRERPPGWNSTLEAAAQSVQPTRIASQVDETAALVGLFRRPILLDAVLLKCALLAVALHEFATVRRGATPNRKLGSLLERGAWHALVAVRFQVRLQMAQNAPRQIRQTLRELLEVAGEVIREPYPVEARRSVYFDLEGPTYASTYPSGSERGGHCQGEALWELLGEVNGSAFERFGRLLSWRQAGLFDDVEMFLRRSAKHREADDTEDVGVLCFSELSDGEQMVLGRMALFHLLRGEDDALLLLDEPETHFNDSWKREIVGIIDDAIGEYANDVLIATHSAIVLSDVFSDEIVKVEKSSHHTSVRTIAERTFAADPSTLMMKVFEANDSIGLRAQAFVERFIEKSATNATPTAADIRRLTALIEHVGSGFYRSELLTLLHRWKRGPDLLEIEGLITKVRSEQLRDELRALLSRIYDQEGGEDA